MIKEKARPLKTEFSPKSRRKNRVVSSLSDEEGAYWVKQGTRTLGWFWP